MVMPQGEAQSYTWKLLEGIVEGEELKHGYLVYIDRWTQYPAEPEEGEEIRYFPVFKKALNFPSIGNDELVEIYEQLQRGLWIVLNIPDLYVMSGEQWDGGVLTEGMFITCVPYKVYSTYNIKNYIAQIYGEETELYRIIGRYSDDYSRVVGRLGSYFRVSVRISKTIPGLDVSADNNRYKCEETDEERVTHYDAEKGMYYADGKLIELNSRMEYTAEINDRTVRVYWPSKSSYERLAADFNVLFPSLYKLGIKPRYKDWDWGADWREGGHCHTEWPETDTITHEMEITAVVRADIDKNGDTFIALYGDESLMRYRSCEFIPGKPTGTRLIDEWDFPLADGTPAGERDANISRYPAVQDIDYHSDLLHGLSCIHSQSEHVGVSYQYYYFYGLSFSRYLNSLCYYGGMEQQQEIGEYPGETYVREDNGNSVNVSFKIRYVPFTVVGSNHHTGLTGIYPVQLGSFTGFACSFQYSSDHPAFEHPVVSVNLPDGLLTVPTHIYWNSDYMNYCESPLAKPIVY